MAATRDITVIGASAGGTRVLRDLLADLPASYPAAVFVVVHLAPEGGSRMDAVLGNGCKLPVAWAREGAPIRPGEILVAPPDRHLMFNDGQVALTTGPRENRHRPSIDALFRSAAVAFGPRVTGVVLSGRLDDGAAGLWAIEKRGGATLVQDPREAEHPDMPRSALEAVPAAESLPAGALAPRLIELAAAKVDGDARAVPRQMAQEVRLATDHDSEMEEVDALGTRVPFTCPECGGALWELEGGMPRFRCHVGHAYSLHTLVAEQTIRVEAALWAALRSLEENERLSQRLAAKLSGGEASTNYHAELARASAAHTKVLRGLLAEIPLDVEPAGD